MPNPENVPSVITIGKAAERAVETEIRLLPRKTMKSENGKRAATAAFPLRSCFIATRTINNGI